jgi:hypothetical protein
MKIEIEVTEQDIKEAVERRIKKTVCEEMVGYISDKLIRSKMEELANQAVENAVKKVASESKSIEARVRAELEKKILNKLKKLTA